MNEHGLTEWVFRQLNIPVDQAYGWPGALFRAAVIFAAGIAASILVSRVVGRALRRIAKKTRSELDDRLVAVAEAPVRQLLIVIGAYYAVAVLPLRPPLSTVGLAVVFAIGVFIAMRAATRMVVVLIAAYGRRVSDMGAKVQFEKDYLPLVSKVLGVVFTVVGLTMVLRRFGQDVSSLIAALGVGGVAISFAAKDTLGNMLSGFVILVDRPFRPGDRIRLASGEIGDVLDVGTRSTRVRLVDQNVLIVPNSELVNTRVTNYNFPTHATRTQVDLNLAYGVDVARAKQAIVETVLAQKGVAHDPPPSCNIVALGDAAVQVNVGFTAAEFIEVAAVQDQVRSAILARAKEIGLKVPG